MGINKENKKKYNIKYWAKRGEKRTKEQIAKKARKYYIKYKTSPDFMKRRRAMDKVYHAVKSGKIFKPTECQKCGSSIRIEAHHFDYNFPLDVRWWCRRCHHNFHYNIKNDSN